MTASFAGEAFNISTLPDRFLTRNDARLLSRQCRYDNKGSSNCLRRIRIISRCCRIIPVRTRIIIAVWLVIRVVVGVTR